MLHPPIKRNSTLHLIQTIKNVKKPESKIKLSTEKKATQKQKEEINYQLLSAKNKLMECHLQTETNLQLLDSHPNEAFILASALIELKDEKIIATHRPLLDRYPNYAFDLAKIISILYKADLIKENSWDAFQESKINITESYYLHMILKKLHDASILNKDNYDLVCENAYYATQICSVIYTLNDIDQDIFQKLMRFAPKAGYIVTRLMVPDFSDSSEIVGDHHRFQSIIKELAMAENILESQSLSS